MSKVTAFELDPAVVGGVDAHPFTFGGFPGLWQVGRPVHPDALGLTVTRMRELVAQFNLPLLEVLIPEGKALHEFEIPANHIETGPPSDPVQPQHELIEVGGELIPGPVASPEPGYLQPTTEAMLARDTAVLSGKPLEATLDEIEASDEGRELAETDPTKQTVEP